MGNCSDKSAKRRKSSHTPVTTNLVQNALCELVETEKNYGEDLNYMIINYLDPLRSEVKFFEQTVLVTFTSVTLDLLQIQKRFQENLDKAVEGLIDQEVDIADMSCKVADIFITSEKEFDIYYKYILCMSRVQKIITKPQGIDKIITFLDQKFQEISQPIISSINANPELSQSQKIMTMESLIMKPFQRVMLYPLMLERIHYECDRGTIDEEKIRSAIKITKKVGRQLNETLKKDAGSRREYEKLLKSYGISEHAKNIVV